jgi:hypothetical protein
MHRLDFSVVRDLTDADLKDLGVVLGSAKRWAYSDMPSFSSQSAISLIAAKSCVRSLG